MRHGVIMPHRRILELLNDRNRVNIKDSTFSSLFAVSQFTKRLELYGGVTTDHICCDTTTMTGGCRCTLHATVAGHSQAQCCADISDYRNSFESSHRDCSDIAEVKYSTFSNISQGNYMCISYSRSVARISHRVVIYRCRLGELWGVIIWVPYSSTPSWLPRDCNNTTVIDIKRYC